MGKSKTPSAEGSLPLGGEPKSDAAKAAEDAELDALLAEEASAKAEAERLADLDALAEHHRAEHEADKARIEVEHLAEASLSEILAKLNSEDADSAAHEPALGLRVKVWPHGGLDWDGKSYMANEVVVIDTSLHAEKAYDRLVANGVLIPQE